MNRIAQKVGKGGRRGNWGAVGRGWCLGSEKMGKEGVGIGGRGQRFLAELAKKEGGEQGRKRGKEGQ